MRAAKDKLVRKTLVLGLAGLLGFTGLVAGCSSDADDSLCQGDECKPPDSPYPTEDTAAILEIYALDIWAQYLPSDASVTVTRNGEQVPVVGFPLIRAPLADKGTYVIRATAPGYRDYEVELEYDGSDGLQGLAIGVMPEERAVVASSHEMRDIPDRGERTIHTIYTGLSHKWFSPSGRPARRGNRIELMMDGEQAWSHAKADLENAQDTIHLSTWWWESQFELVRDRNNLTASEDQRRPNTILSILDNSPATKRVIVGQFFGQDGLLDGLTIDSDLKQRGKTAGDNFEFMGQANETSGQFTWQPDAFDFTDRIRDTYLHTTRREFDPEDLHASFISPQMVDLTEWPIGIDVEHASFHQKFFVADDKVAYIGGMNLRRVDWDTSKHEVFDPRRMLFDASSADRQAVADKEQEPDMGPRKDYIMRIEGPSARDASDVFKRRWDLLRTEHANYSEASSAFDIATDADPDPDASSVDGSMVQVTATLPSPLSEAAIAESWIQAVENANDYIYIEDQYFRAPLLFDAIAKRMREVPNLQLVVITKPVDEWLDPGCEWTYRSDEVFRQFGDRYHLFQLRAFDYAVSWGIDETDAHFLDMDVHSKMLMVDDKFMSVGSANKNNRGMIYEGELNVAVYDPTWVGEQRRRILTNILPDGVSAGDDPATWIQQLSSAASWNDSVYSNWDAEGMDLNLNGAAPSSIYIPQGFIYSLQFRDHSKCLIEGVGPDMT